MEPLDIEIKVAPAGGADVVQKTGDQRSHPDPLEVDVLAADLVEEEIERPHELHPADRRRGRGSAHEEGSAGSVERRNCSRFTPAARKNSASCHIRSAPSS